MAIHGYDSIFCAGGTQEELPTLAEHKVTFDAHDFYRALLDCPVPVIAAMQGHALGGGLVFGLYADLVVMAQEAIYSANFMKYGFTPGIGSTMVLPMKFGATLANEMLSSARGHHGGALRERGIRIPVVLRAETVATALKPAEDLADKPDVALRLLKQAMTHRLRLDLPDVIAARRRYMKPPSPNPTSSTASTSASVDDADHALRWVRITGMARSNDESCSSGTLAARHAWRRPSGARYNALRQGDLHGGHSLLEHRNG
ncbi:MAG: polyketide synthase [Solimonas sp.]